MVERMLEMFELVFENSDSIKIPVEYIRFIKCMDITKDIFINLIKQFIKIDRIDNFSIELDYKVLGLRSILDNSFQEKLDHQDITQIVFYYLVNNAGYHKQQVVETYSVYWKDRSIDNFSNSFEGYEFEDDSSNEFQKYFFTENYIKIEIKKE